MPPKTKAKTPSQAKRPRVDERPLLGCNLTKSQKVFWNNVHGRELNATKFFDIPTLDLLHLTSCVRTFLGKGGMSGFISVIAPTYERFTLEFLCTLEVDWRARSITFQLGNKPFSMEFATLARVFGLDDRISEVYDIPNSQVLSDFWFHLTGSPFSPDGDKSSSIPHPGLRLILRTISMGFFCHGEPSNVASWELGHFWAFSPDALGIPDWVKLFLVGCLECRAATRGKISMGGMITLIAKALNVRLSGEVPLSTMPEMNITSLSRMKMILKDRNSGRYVWLFGQSSVPYLWIPRAIGFPTGPHNRDLFVSSDPDIGRALLEGPMDPPIGEDVGVERVVERRADVRFEREATNAPMGNDWVDWRRRVDSELRSIRDTQEDHTYALELAQDRQDETLDYIKSLSALCVSSFPSSYVPPDVQRYRDADSRRERERKLRDDLRAARARGGAGPSGSH